MLNTIEKELLLKTLDLQFFAEGDANKVANTEEANTNEDKTETKEEPLTMEMVQKMIQSESDKVRTEYSKKLKEKEKEIEKIKVEKMTDEEKKMHEFEKIQAELQAYKQKALEGDAVALLSKNSLPVELVPFVLGENTEAIEQNVSSLNSIFTKAVQEATAEKFKGLGTDHKGGASAANTITKEDFMKMDAIERTKFFNDYPELYAEYTK